MNSLSKLLVVLRKPLYLAIALIASVLLFAAYAVFGNIFVLGTLTLNPLGFDYLTLLLMLVLSFGGGLFAATWLYRRNYSPKVCAPAAVGGALGFAASACPYCPPVLAWFFGAQSLYFLSSYGFLLAFASVALVYYSLYSLLEVV